MWKLKFRVEPLMLPCAGLLWKESRGVLKDAAKECVKEGAEECARMLEKTIARDAHHPCIAAWGLGCVAHCGFAGEEVLHDRPENGRLQVRPFAIVLGHAYEIGAEKDA